MSTRYALWTYYDGMKVSTMDCRPFFPPLPTHQKRAMKRSNLARIIRIAHTMMLGGLLDLLPFDLL
jgi:hypothetical protein